MSGEKFSKCGKGENVSVKFRVFEKKRKLNEKFRKKKSKCFRVKVKVKDFAKFVFTGRALC